MEKSFSQCVKDADLQELQVFKLMKKDPSLYKNPQDGLLSLRDMMVNSGQNEEDHRIKSKLK